MELDGSSSAEVVVNIANMMAGFLNHFSKALNTVANYPASEITAHHHLEPKQFVDQEQKRFMIGNIYNMKTAERFKSLNPPTFNGLAGPEAAEVWMKQINEILEVILAPQNLCINLAGRMLTGRALVWFKQIKIDKLKNMSQFTRRFLQVYSPAAFRRVCGQKNWLSQRNMSIEEYQKLYESDNVNYASDETDRMHFFYMGLNPFYRRILGETMLNSYKELVEFTLIVERIVNHITEGKVVNFGDYFTKNRRIRYYLECSKELISAVCFFCGSVKHNRNKCPLRNNQVQIQNKKFEAKVQKSLKVKKLEFCKYCKSTGHYARNCPHREKAGELGLVCFVCGSREHKRSKCPLSKSKGQKRNAENLSDSLQDSNKKFKSVPESSEDKVEESRLVCFGCGSRDHKRNKCPLARSKGQKQNAENLQQNNKKFTSVTDSSGESRSACFGCGSREHCLNQCPLMENQVGKPSVKNLRKSFQNYNNSNKAKIVPESADSPQNKCSIVPESSGDTAERPKVCCFHCRSKEHIWKGCPILETKRQRQRKSFQNNNNSNESKSVPESSADSPQNKCSNVPESSGDAAKGSKARCCFACRSNEHTKKDCPVLKSKRQSLKENNLKRKRSNESVLTDARSCKAKI